MAEYPKRQKVYRHHKEVPDGKEVPAWPNRKESRIRDLHSGLRGDGIDHGLYEGEMDSRQGNRERDVGSVAESRAF